jgi:hypothetical protein
MSDPQDPAIHRPVPKGPVTPIQPEVGRNTGFVSEMETDQSHQDTEYIFDTYVIFNKVSLPRS